VKLTHLDAWTEARRRNAARYRQGLSEAGCVRLENEDGLSGIPAIQVPYEVPEGRHVYNQFVIRTPQRNGLMAHLRQCHVGTEVYYPLPMHLQECFAHLGYHKGDFPISETAAQESLALPIYAELAETQLGVVVSAIVEAVKGARQRILVSS
jgi:dTDP-4-amino-4,6-dideoxygalactose transaminase